MKAVMLSLAIGIGGIGVLMNAGCERTIKEDTKVRTSDGRTTVKQERVSERPDGSIVKEERRSTSDNP